MKILDRAKGSLIGGACGDSLGYSVEFTKYDDILKKYGEAGITSYDLVNGKALISDDTQMTLFTASGLLVGKANDASTITEYNNYIYQSYLDWYYTQTFVGGRPNISWISNLEDLCACRAPGTTCLNSLGSGVMGSEENILNTSKGCGAVMRVTPIGIFGAYNKLSLLETGMLCVKASMITHSHSLGYIPSFTLGCIIYELCNEKSLSEAIMVALELTSSTYKDDKHYQYYEDLIKKAIELSKNNEDDITNIKSLGEGWVGEEALAIAIYASLKYQDNFKKALVASVNHSGDSDSTGAITGNILGCYLGILAIDYELKEHLELYDEIIQISEDLCNDEVDLTRYKYLFEL